jgi:hypothetical protein
MGGSSSQQHPLFVFTERLSSLSFRIEHSIIWITFSIDLPGVCIYMLRLFSCGSTPNQRIRPVAVGALQKSIGGAGQASRTSSNTCGRAWAVVLLLLFLSQLAGGVLHEAHIHHEGAVIRHWHLGQHAGCNPLSLLADSKQRTGHDPSKCQICHHIAIHPFSLLTSSSETVFIQETESITTKFLPQHYALAFYQRHSRAPPAS